MKHMKNSKKVMLAHLIILLIVLSFFPNEIKKVKAADINAQEVFLSQYSYGGGSGYCTLASNVNMLRRYALLRGDSNWNDITLASTKSQLWNGGMAFNYTYSGISVACFSSDDGFVNMSDKAGYIRNLLLSHPEGIVLYDWNTASCSSKQHAILVTDYTDGIFYCADPADQNPNRKPISDSLVKTINQCEQYWIVTSGTPVNTDKSGPSYSDFHVGEIRADGSGFTVMAKINDPSGISSVKYAVWTEKNGQDDLRWYTGHNFGENDYYWERIDSSNHNNEKDKYIIHLYAYDNAGNEMSTGITFDFNTKGPVCSDFHVGEFREGAFTVLSKITDVNGLGEIKYAVWTDKNGQDDLKWYGGNCFDANNIFWARISFADHNNEKGKYIIHLYAYDTAGQLTNIGISYVFPETGPAITNVEVSDVTSKGYTVTCKVDTSNDDIGVKKVQFPTWTQNKGQDDLISDWESNKNASGTIKNNFVTFKVDSSKHNNETGTYITHIYAYDVFGNVTAVSVPGVNAHDHELSIIEGKKATCTVDGLSDGKKCSICGKVIEEQSVVKASGHDYFVKVIDPTQTSKGYTLHTCTKCGDSYKDNYVDVVIEKNEQEISENQDRNHDEKKLDSDNNIDKQESEVEHTSNTGNSNERKSIIQNGGDNNEAVKVDTTNNYTNTQIKFFVIKIKSVKNNKKRSITIRWKKKSGVDGYQVSYSKDKKFSGAKKKNLKYSNDSVTIKGLKKGKTYYVRIRTYVKNSNGNKVYGKWSSVKKVKIKK